MMRILWRWIAPPPPLAGVVSTLEQRLSGLSHFLLYVVLFAMPISGYLISAAGGHPVTLFNIVTIPGVVPVDKGLAEFGRQMHGLGEWALYALVAVHVLAAGYHHVVRRDAVFRRILPW